MSKLLIDTNVLIDAVVEERPESAEACEVLDRCNGSGDLGMASALSLKDVYNILSKQMSEGQARQFIRDICSLVIIAPVSAEEIDEALRSDEPDFEDGLIRFCAELNGVDFIITRDADAFATSPVRSVTAAEYLDIARKRDAALEWWNEC